jgi:hypothetical protein
MRDMSMQITRFPHYWHFSVLQNFFIRVYYEII